MTTDRSREAFEKWYAAKFKRTPSRNTKTNIPVDYCDIVAETHWQAWNAARADMAEGLCRATQEQKIPGNFGTEQEAGRNTGLDIAIAIIRTYDLCSLGLTDAKRQEEAKEHGVKVSGAAPDNTTGGKDNG